MRLDKYLAHAGIGTRKEVKQLIHKGRVRIGSNIITQNDAHIDELASKVYVDDEEVVYMSNYTIMMNKPKDCICALSDPIHRTVMEYIDLPYKDLFPIGRLDMDTEGLLLLSNDGALSHRLLSPKNHITKTYLVDIQSKLSEHDIAQLENGRIVLDNEALQPAFVEVLKPNQILLTITQGKYHQVKRMLAAVHNEVLSLKRVSMGSLALDQTLKPGEWRFLTDEELQCLSIDPIC